jgi:hypothetical protein
MHRTLALFGTLALLPAMLGPLKVEARVFVALSCGGGAKAIPILPDHQPPGPPQGPCCAKGCHSDRKRKRLDRSQ